MTRKIAISVPDDVAERLDREPNVSAFITEAVRRRMLSERVRHALAENGRPVTEDGVAQATAKIESLNSTVTPELRRAADELRAKILNRRPS